MKSKGKINNAMIALGWILLGLGIWAFIGSLFIPNYNNLTLEEIHEKHDPGPEGGLRQLRAVMYLAAPLTSDNWLGQLYIDIMGLIGLNIFSIAAFICALIVWFRTHSKSSTVIMVFAVLVIASTSIRYEIPWP